jgi:hypothetical protein
MASLRSPLLRKAAGVVMSVAGWWLVAGTVIVAPFALAHFDFTEALAIGGILVLSLYVALVVGLAIVLIRRGRQLRGGSLDSDKAAPS